MKSRSRKFQLLGASIAVIVVLSIETPPLIVLSDGQYTLDETLAKAIELSDRQDFAAAITILDQAIDQVPETPDLFLVRGVVYRISGDYKNAISDLNRTLELDPTQADGYCQRAFAFQQRAAENWPKQTIIDASRAIEIDNGISLAYIVRGNARAAIYEYQKAISDFSAAIRVNPNSYSAYGNRAWAYVDSGDPEKARKDLDSAFAIGMPAADRKQLEELSLILNDLEHQD